MSMSIHSTRTGNPGVVPPWLQHPAPIGTTQPAPPVAPSLIDSSTASPAFSRIIVVIRPGGAHAPESGAARRQPSRADDQLQQEADRQVADIRNYFKRVGVRDDEGNDGSATVISDPDFKNAEYVPGEDVIRIGTDPRSNEGRSFTEADDVVAHEWSHRIVEHLAPGMLGSLEDAAIHESLADTFAAGYDASDWTLGENLGEPVRDMLHPERLGHPGTVREAVRVLQKYGAKTDPHVLAGVPNRAAALIGEELGRDTMMDIYLDATRNYVRPNGEVEGLALATIKSASELYGRDSREVAATMQAWKAVGIIDEIQRRQQG